jgi:tetraacyldisaccharide 4'-kinase
MKKYLYRVITGQIHGFLPALIRVMLTPLSWKYGGVVMMRNRLYDAGLLHKRHLPCTVISVGNIVAGGSGKTPTVIWLAKVLRKAGMNVAILLRGYGRKSDRPMAVVSDGEKILMPTMDTGDEAAMIAETLPGVPVIVGRDRYEAGREAIRLWNTNVLILDDGFQHRRLARDLDIVTVDATQPFGMGRLLPAGTLREPTSALRRADIILLTRIDLAESLPQVQRAIEKVAPGLPIAESCHQPTGLYQLDTGEKSEPHRLKDRRLLALCGIGNPAAFIETLRQYEPRCLELLAFPDHHRYTQADFRQIQNRASGIRADSIVTTQKDAPKLKDFLESGNVPVYVLVVELVVTSGEDILKGWLLESVFANR